MSNKLTEISESLAVLDFKKFVEDKALVSFNSTILSEYSNDIRNLRNQELSREGGETVKEDKSREFFNINGHLFRQTVTAISFCLMLLIIFML